ncbi:MAG: hypothetical protein R3179_03320 [Sedimenticolaceae bacterium]|nr:hypothetical protein [Sedimenticolaceae bacterium]
MRERTLLSVIESPTHPNFGQLYSELGFEHWRVDSMRKAISQLRKRAPDFIVAEFFYGYGNNYAGVNLSNLDVLLASLPKYAPQALVILLAAREEMQYVDKLRELFPVHAVLQQPVQVQQMRELLG